MTQTGPEKYSVPVTDGETLHIWGIPHRITFLPDKKPSFTIRDGRILLAMPVNSDDSVRERFVKKELRKRLELQIAKRLPPREREMGLYSKSHTVRDMKSRWGTCNTGTARITFSLELIRFDPVCLDYIIVHELAHLRHANHSRAFWNLVGRYRPDWKSIRRMMDHNEDEEDLTKTDAGD